jgi:hypothetical protein
MAQVMKNIPETYCYCFDYVEGRLSDVLGMAWAPGNPDYDPGPPPPTKPPQTNPLLPDASTAPQYSQPTHPIIASASSIKLKPIPGTKNRTVTRPKKTNSYNSVANGGRLDMQAQHEGQTSRQKKQGRVRPP